MGKYEFIDFDGKLFFDLNELSHIKIRPEKRYLKLYFKNGDCSKIKYESSSELLERYDALYGIIDLISNKNIEDSVE